MGFGMSGSIPLAGNSSNGSPSASFAFGDDAPGHCEHVAQASCGAARSAAGCLASKDAVGWSHCAWVNAVRGSCFVQGKVQLCH